MDFFHLFVCLFANLHLSIVTFEVFPSCVTVLLLQKSHVSGLVYG